MRPLILALHAVLLVGGMFSCIVILNIIEHACIRLKIQTSHEKGVTMKVQKNLHNEVNANQ